MHKELVSIIMPMHNSAKYIGEAITSVINQTYDKWELLVIDDVSNDNSCDIVREYINEIIEYIFYSMTTIQGALLLRATWA